MKEFKIFFTYCILKLAKQAFYIQKEEIFLNVGTHVKHSASVAKLPIYDKNSKIVGYKTG